jgi:hypothetical protein
MKKFGKKTQTISEDIVDYNFNEENNFYENEMSKKLKISNNPINDNNFIFKSKTNKVIDIETNKPNLKNKSKMKRLSELEQRNLYNILNLSEFSSIEQIKKSYKLLCMKCHPDKGGDAEAFSKIVDAYNILSNPICRKLYDRFSYQALDICEYILTLDNLECIDFDIDNCDLDVFKLILQSKN